MTAECFALFVLLEVSPSVRDVILRRDIFTRSWQRFFCMSSSFRVHHSASSLYSNSATTTSSHIHYTATGRSSFSILGSINLLSNCWIIQQGNQSIESTIQQWAGPAPRPYLHEVSVTTTKIYKPITPRRYLPT